MHASGSASGVKALNINGNWPGNPLLRKSLFNSLPQPSLSLSLSQARTRTVTPPVAQLQIRSCTLV